MPSKKDKRTQKQNSKSSKKRTSPLTVSVSMTATSEENSDTTLVATPEQININHVLNQALVRYKNDAAVQDKHHKLKEISHLGNMVEEFLSCFTLIGFTMQGEKVCIFNAKTSKDEGALVDLLRSTFLEIVNNRP